MEENEIQFNNRLNLSDLQASVFQIKAELSKVIVGQKMWLIYY